MKYSVAYSVAFIAALAVVFAANAQPTPTAAPTTTTIGSPLIIADLSDGPTAATTAFPSPYTSNRNADFGADFRLAITNYINSLSSSSSGLGVSMGSPHFVDTKGNFLTAMSGVQNAINTAKQNAENGGTTSLPFSFAVVADSATLTTQIVAALQENLPAATPIFIASSTADTGMLDGDNDVTDNSGDAIGNVFRVAGTDSSGIASNIVEVLFKLKQITLCAIVTDDIGGNSFIQAIQKDMATRPKGYPVLLKSVKVLPNPGNSARTNADAAAALTASDNAAMNAVASSPQPCTSVLIGGEGDIAARMLSARQRMSATLPALNSAFFFFAPSATARFPMPSSADAAIPNQALFTATEWKPLSTMADRLAIQDLDSVNDAFSIFTGLVVDSIGLAAVAASKSTSGGIAFSAIFAQTLTTGYTTPFRLSGATQSRAQNQCRVHLIRLNAASSADSTILAEWVSSSSVAVSSAGSSAVPAQTSEPFVVCLVGQQTCPTLSELNHAYFTLLSEAPNVLPPSVSVVVKAVSAGTLGITRIAKVAEAANVCDFVIGPGSSATARNLFPFFNYYGVPMVDFSSADTSLSDQISFSTYTRTNPTDEYVARVAGGTFKNFGWESVAIVTTLDQYGSEIVKSYSAGLAASRVAIEASLMIPVSNLNNDTIYRTLQKVQTQLITRIVILAISSTDEVHATFFRNIVDLQMTGTQIFWLSDSLCQYSALNPGARTPLQNSFCASPMYNVGEYRRQYDAMLQSDLPGARALFQRGGFDVSSCKLQNSDMYAPFASDAALTVLDTIKRISDGVNGDVSKIVASQHNLTLLMNLIHTTKATGITGIIAFDPVTGERTNAAYNVDIQQPKQVIKFAHWNSGTGFFLIDLPEPIIWFNNGTEIPKYTTRDMRFIITTTVKRNTASVILSIVGFIVTVSIFVFCYKHYKLKKMVAGVEEQQQQQGAGGNNGGGVDASSAYPGPGQGVSVEMQQKTY